MRLPIAPCGSGSLPYPHPVPDHDSLERLTLPCSVEQLCTLLVDDVTIDDMRGVSESAESRELLAFPASCPGHRAWAKREPGMRSLLDAYVSKMDALPSLPCSETNVWSGVSQPSSIFSASGRWKGCSGVLSLMEALLSPDWGPGRRECDCAHADLR